MAMTEESTSRWKAKTSAELQGTSAEQVWPLLEEFCNIQKWVPIETCYQVEGVAGQPGFSRYCATNMKDYVDPERTVNKWAKERLPTIDPMQRCLSYEIVDSNMGFKSYVATLKVLPIISGDEKHEGGCIMEWSFVCDPVEGWTFEGWLSLIQYFLQSMATKMQLACSATRS